MFRVTRKQKIVQNGNVIEFEDSLEESLEGKTEIIRWSMVQNEIDLGGQYYGHNMVIFESPTFYRSVTVTIEKVSDA